MTIEIGFWRVDEGVQAIPQGGMASEETLENVLAEKFSIIDPELLIVGRQVSTSHRGRLDLLAMNAYGRLTVVELKRDSTPRESVAQLLDYGSWVGTIDLESLDTIYRRALARVDTDDANPRPATLRDAFAQKFGDMPFPTELDDGHDLLLVAAQLDAASERIIDYLRDDYGLNVNAVMFRVFHDDGRTYLSRAWLKDPAEADANAPSSSTRPPWNGEAYANFGDSPSRRWTDARKHGFLAAGGGDWYSRTLRSLNEGERVWVQVPGHGFVGVGTVTGPPAKFDAFEVAGEDGVTSKTRELALEGTYHQDEAKDDESLTEWLVPVSWLKTVPIEDGISEVGLFGNQNTVCRPRSQKWNQTVERLARHWGISVD